MGRLNGLGICRLAIAPDYGHEVGSIGSDFIGTGVTRIIIPSANSPAVLLLFFARLERPQYRIGH